MSPNKVVIVTGASRGIGRSICQLLAKPLQNCNVVAVARSEDALQEIEQQNEGRVAIVSGDLADLSTARKAVSLALDKWSRLDGLVVNHGVLEPVEKLADADIDHWKRSFDINVINVVALIKAAMPSLRQSKGKIIFTSSGAAVKGTSTWGAYCAGKAVLNSLARTLAEEESEVVTIAIRPGVVETEMQDIIAKNSSKMQKKDNDKYASLRAEGKMLRPEQPGNVMARLVLDADKDLTGQFLNWNDEKLAKFQDL